MIFYHLWFILSHWRYSDKKSSLVFAEQMCEISCIMSLGLSGTRRTISYFSWTWFFGSYKELWTSVRNLENECWLKPGFLLVIIYKATWIVLSPHNIYKLPGWLEAYMQKVLRPGPCSGCWLPKVRCGYSLFTKQPGFGLHYPTLSPAEFILRLLLMILLFSRHHQGMEFTTYFSKWVLGHWICKARRDPFTRNLSTCASKNVAARASKPAFQGASATVIS